ncbi:MAG: amidohydrolase family protein [Planctomycetes bacterium]|nr:amidohydrolase family protein [Planctomycetota bacterium]
MNNHSRRQFLKQTIPPVAGFAMGGWSVASLACDRDEPAVATIIDCHTHFYDPTRPEGVPWPTKDDKLLYRRVLPAEYKAIAKPLGVTGTVVVEASPWVEDNQWVLDLAAKDTFIVGLVGHLAPGGDDFEKRLKRFAKNPLFRGIRIVSAKLAAGLDQDQFLRDLKLLAEHDLELDANGGPGMLADVARLAKRVPELRVVVNHLANVRVDGKAPPADWVQGMRAAAEQPSVFCKVSALVEGATVRDGKAPTELGFYVPVLDMAWNAFGEDRLIYGSNWPVSERFASYATVQRIVREYFQGKGRGVAEKFFARNALAAYKYMQR